MSQSKPNAPPSNLRVILFMVTLSFVCALILSVLASALKKPQEIAQELDRSKQMLIAARIINPAGYFQVQNEEGKYVPAKVTGETVLEPSEETVYATADQILNVFRKRIRPMVVNSKGELSTFEKAGLDPQTYIPEHQKNGYYTLPWKLIYEILPNNGKDDKPVGYVIPINGFGLWDAIYGFLAIEPDGKTAIGTSWYQQKETPGLGANISEPAWQDQFHGKLLFQPSPGGEVDFQTAPLGISVVKGKVSDVYGEGSKAKSAVDGIAGATLTGNGVMNAYKDVLEAYRPFLMKLGKEPPGEKK